MTNTQNINLLNTGPTNNYSMNFFCEQVLDNAWHRPSKGRHMISGRLWNCTSIMPRDVCEALDLPQGSSYAQGSRAMRSHWRR